MNLAEIEDVLNRALPMRVPGGPTLGTSARERIAALEDYLLASAHINGELVEARHWLRELESTLTDQWEHLEGWEVGLRRPRAKATKQDIQEAKVRSSPGIFEAGRKARRLRESVVDQIARFEREATIVSRAYTIITGS